MSLTSARLSLSYLAEAQAQKHVTINESLRRLDALVHLGVASRTRTDQPAAPSEGEAYILGPDMAGEAWAGAVPGSVAVFQDGAWALIAPVKGMVVHIADEDAIVVYTDEGWKTPGAFAELGINTRADGANRLAVKSDAALFSHDDVTPGSGDMRLVVNKAAENGTASVLFQTAFEGRAEFGLTGTDDFAIKVSGDDGVYRDAIVIDRQTGSVSFPNTP